MLDRPTKRRLLQQFKNTEQLTYYKTLELEKSATFDEIKTAYHNFIRRSHPDRVTKPEVGKPDLNCGDCGFCEICVIHEDVYGDIYRNYEIELEEAEDRSKLLNESWDVLQDAETREFYDEFLRDEVVDSDHAGSGSETDISFVSFDSDFDWEDLLNRKRRKLEKKRLEIRRLRKMEERPDYEAFEVHNRSWFYRFVVIPVVVYCIAYHWLVPSHMKYQSGFLL